MTFHSQQTVRFSHVDFAGIVFYPRYFEMVNSVVEDYFASTIGVDFATMHGERQLGVPTVSLKAEFMLPSRLGDLLDFHLRIMRVGHSSAELQLEASCRGQLRTRITVVLVCMELSSGRAVPWPSDMRPIEAVQAA